MKKLREYVLLVALLTGVVWSCVGQVLPGPGFLTKPASGAAFSPLSLSPALWLDAADAATVNTTTRVWGDKSGNSRNASGAAGEFPAYLPNGLNNLPCVSFSATNLISLPLANSVSNTFSILAVFRITGQSADFPIMFNARTSTNATAWYTHPYYQPISPLASSTSFYSARNSVRTAMGLSYANTYVYSLIENGGNAIAATDGVDRAIYTGGAAPPPTNMLLINSAASLGGGNGMNLLLQEILIYPTALTTAQRQRVEGYLAWKWGTVASLPAGHPYKTASP